MPPKQRFQPHNVPIVSFGMFRDQMVEVAEPAATMAQRIGDPTIAAYFRDLSKKGLGIRKKTFEELIEKIPEVSSDKEKFEKMIGPCCVVFDEAVSDYHWETRKLAVDMMDAVTHQLTKQEFAQRAGKILPPLVFLIFDSEPRVSEAARGLLKRYIETPEKQNLMFSKLRNEMAKRIRSAVSELQNPDWALEPTEKDENWGRICNSCLVVASYVLRACQGDENVFASFGNIPVMDWLKLTKGQFAPRMLPVARGAAYIYLVFCLQKAFVQVTPNTVLELVKAETSAVGQEKLLKLVQWMLERKGLDQDAVKDALLASIQFYYQPTRVKLGELLTYFGDVQFLQKCIDKVVTLNDLSTATELFNCLMTVMPECLPEPYVLGLFEKAVSSSPPSRFFAGCSLKPFLYLRDNEKVKKILEDGDEARSFEFLALYDAGDSVSWLKSRKEITPKTLSKIVKSCGAAPIRNTWPTLAEIPIKGNDVESLVAFVLLYAHSDEIPLVVEQWPDCIPRLLHSWTGDFACFKCPKLLEIAPDLLEKDMRLIRFLFYIFPGNEDLTKLINEKVKTHLLKDSQFDPEICDYFKPNDDLLDAILFSSGVEVLQSGDSVVKLLVKRIVDIAGKAKPGQLAEAAAALVESASLDPSEISVSPIDEPIFCYEFWSRIGFDHMNANDFCFLLNSYISSYIPWMESEIYVHQVDWKQLPNPVLSYVKKHREFANVARECKLTLALACICAACNLDLIFFGENVNGVVLSALSSEKPPACLDCDNLSKVISSDWNERVPDYPDFSMTGEDELRLRQAIAYLQHYLPVVEDFTDFIALAKETIASESHMTFFLTLRLMSLIYEGDCGFDVDDVMKTLIKQIVRFEKFPAVVESELAAAFRIGRYMTPDEFEPFLLSLVDQFNTKASVFLAHQVVPLISFFNRWDLIETRLQNKLNLENIAPWHLITTSFLEMPFQKRLDLVPEYVKLLPPLFDRLKPDDPDFIMLISSFPSAAMKWFTKLQNNKSRPLMVAMDKGGTDKVFRALANAATRLNLQCTKITQDIRNRVLHAEYVEDESSVPVRLDLSFPKGYPFCQVKVHCEFGNEGEECAHKVASAIIAGQSIEAGIKAWHQFITYRLVDAEPCTICYSYISDDGKRPAVACPTCGNMFHGKCLGKWFSKCLKPTCPYCASPWEQKKK